MTQATKRRGKILHQEEIASESLNFPFFPLFCFTLFLRALIALSTALCVILYLTLILLILAKYGEFPTQGEQATGQNDQELPELYDTK